MIRLRLAAALALACLAATRLPAQTQLLGFADVQARSSDDPNDHSSFFLGQYVAHVHGHMAKDWTFLGESVFEVDPATGEFSVDVERIIIGWSPSDQFQFSVGKEHSPIGAWNNTYHHGTLFQPTITRPLLVQFEDDGGILPVHSLGMRAAGHEISKAHLGYDVMLANGTGGTADGDNNNSKAIFGSVFAEPLSGIRVGLSAYTDHLTTGTATLGGGTLAADMDQTAFGGFAVFDRGALQLHGEVMQISNKTLGATTGNTGAFVYAGYRVRTTWVPYALYEFINYDAADPYFATDDYRQGILGLRHDISSMLVIKVEYHNRHTTLTGTVNEAAAQIAVGF